jgi:hypothetical protein
MNAIDTWNPPGKNGKPQGKKGGDAFVLALATGLSVPQAAKRAGIGTSTAYRRLEDPATRKAVSKARDDLLCQVVGRLAAVAVKAVDVLEANLHSKSDAIRNRAALGILANMIRGMDSVELARRLTELEEGQ